MVSPPLQRIDVVICRAHSTFSLLYDYPDQIVVLPTSRGLAKILRGGFLVRGWGSDGIEDIPCLASRPEKEIGGETGGTEKLSTDCQRHSDNNACLHLCKSTKEVRGLSSWMLRLCFSSGVAYVRPVPFRPEKMVTLKVNRGLWPVACVQVASHDEILRPIRSIGNVGNQSVDTSSQVWCLFAVLDTSSASRAVGTSFGKRTRGSRVSTSPRGAW